jgi:nondiscriminating glutamyl-tRNA synthetase
VLMKSDGFPTYHLANVVDDHLMRISHVIRGEEWLPSTPKHIQLYRDFGWEPPAFAHLPLLLNADRSKLSKRQGDVATEDYRQKGFLPEALINFVALLGWHAADDREIFSLPELIEHFSLERVNKTGAVFDTDKLRWMNQQYLKQLTLDDLFNRLQPFLPETISGTDPSLLKKAISIVRDSLVTLDDIGPRLAIFYDRQPTLTDEILLAQVREETAQKVFQAFLAKLNTVESLTAENFGPLMKTVQKATGIKGKPLWVPIRIAITHSEHGPDLTAMVDFFGLDKCRRLIEAVIKKP